MEWTLLMLFALVLVFPVVLLWGYAGCSFEPGPFVPVVPVNLTVTNVSSTSVSLSWIHDDVTEGVTFEVERLKDGDTTPVVLATAETTITDTSLLIQTLYRYRVRAVYGTFPSEFSAQVEATTLGPHPCFSSTLMTDQPGIEGFCIVQALSPLGWPQVGLRCSSQ